jgi:hypothetical protein
MGRAGDGHSVSNASDGVKNLDGHVWHRHELFVKITGKCHVQCHHNNLSSIDDSDIVNSRTFQHGALERFKACESGLLRNSLGMRYPLKGAHL